MLNQNAIATVHRYEGDAQRAAGVVRDVLKNFRGTDAELIQKLKLTEENGDAWLFVVLDDIRIPSYQPYVTALHALSTSLRGRKVYISNSSGFRYGVLLSKRRALPKEIMFPGNVQRSVQIGVRSNGRPFATSWEELGHVLVAGMTQFGKSTFLRLLTLQARADGFQFLLGDLDGRTFSRMKDDPSLILPVASTEAGFDGIVDAAILELKRRVQLFEATDWHPDNLDEYNSRANEPLPPVMVMMDEFSSVAWGMGGPNGKFAKKATQIAWRGLKFGIHVVLAGQDFSKDIVGPIREQMRTRLCFRVERPKTSEVVIGRYGAERLTIPGRAMMPAGMVQTYLVAKDALGNGDQAKGPAVSEAEGQLMDRLWSEVEGRADLVKMQEFGQMSERTARTLREDWERRGLAEKRGDRNNAYFLVQTPWTSKPVQTVSKRPNAVQTGLDGQF